MTHRFGQKRDSNSKPRTAIIKFSWCNIRKKFDKSEKKLQGKNVSTTENLTGYSVSILNEASMDIRRTDSI